MKVLINNSVIELYNNKLYDYYLFDSNNPIIISDKINNNKYYTYIIINIDAISNNNSIYKYYIHLLIINNNNIILDYQKPTPPKFSGQHKYYIFIYEQYTYINFFTTERITLNLDNFINNFKLLLVDQFMFKVIHI
jgi:hypothetical protein